MTIDSAREDTCRCGSGKPYRQCCGAVIPIAAATPAPTASAAWIKAMPPTPNEAQAPLTNRTCGGCTACCDGWLTANVLGHDLSPGKPCRFRGEHSCTIYEHRPHDPCRGFICGWLVKGNPFPESFRPDRLGVIIIIKPWRDRFAYVLVEAGRAPDAKLLEWMREHSIATGRPFLFQVDGRQRGYGSDEFQKEIIEKASRGEPLLPGLNSRSGGPCKLMPLDPAVADVGAPRGADVVRTLEEQDGG